MKQKRNIFFKIVGIVLFSGYFLKCTPTLKKLPQRFLNDIPGENTLSNKTQALAKSITFDIWVIGTLNQLSIRGFYT